MNQITATFGRPTTRSNRFEAFRQDAPAQSNQQEKRPPAEFWLNVGYLTDNEKYPFIALPVGIPLSLDDRKEIRGSSEYTQFLSAQNDLLEELLEAAARLNPGEEEIISHPEMPLALQLRRVRGEQEQVPAGVNPLSRRGMLFATPAPQAAPAVEA